VEKRGGVGNTKLKTVPSRQAVGEADEKSNDEIKLNPEGHTPAPGRGKRRKKRRRYKGPSGATTRPGGEISENRKAGNPLGGAKRRGHKGKRGQKKHPGKTGKNYQNYVLLHASGQKEVNI